jgi:hypothetical protein
MPAMVTVTTTSKDVDAVVAEVEDVPANPSVPIKTNVNSMTKLKIPSAKKPRARPSNSLKAS